MGERKFKQNGKPSAEKGLKINRFFTKAGANPFNTIEYEKRTSLIRNTDGSIVFKMDNVEVPKFWSQVATDILAQKYFRKTGVPQHDATGKKVLDDNGEQVLGSETSIKQIVHRLAGCWTHWGKKAKMFATEEDAKTFYDELAYMLLNQYAAPNSPQWFNTGLNYAYGTTGPAQGHYYVDFETGELTRSTDAFSRPQVHACYILPVKDDLVNEGGIMDLWLREARIFKYGSGSGTNYSTLRGKGEPLSGGGHSSGLMSWLKIGDRAAGAIKSGGTTRRAAKMVILDIDHPDIETFINWKVEEEKKVAALIAAGYPSDYEGEAYQTIAGQNSNNSVRVPNRFMRAVLNDDKWDLRWRTNGKVCKTLKARELWEQICFAAWACADPGLQMDTTINEWHTCPALGRINASNPCSEFMFIDNTACNLASLNLMKFFDKTKLTFDIEAFKHAVRLWTIVLEISVVMAQFPAKEIADMTYRTRSLGLGYTNIGTVLMVSGIPYDSDKARTIIGGITALMTGESYATSAEMAKHFGTFKEYEPNQRQMLRVMRNHRRAAYDSKQEGYENLEIVPLGIDQSLCPKYILSAVHDSWDRAVNLGEEYGYRNAQVSLVAPTGTISLLMDCDTTGIEPEFGLVKFKKLAGGGYFKILNQSVLFALKTLGYNQEQIKDIIKYISGANTLRGSPYINSNSLREKGLKEDDLVKIEKVLPSVFDLNSAFNAGILGDEAMRRLNISADKYKSPTFNLLKYFGFTDKQIEEANDYTCGTMTIEGAPHLKHDHLAVFDCSNKCGRKGKRFIQYMAHIKAMAVAQPLISGSISKTINMPHEATVDDIKDAYMESWKLGLKSIALYREGSKLSQPLAAKLVQAKKDQIECKPSRIKLPDERRSITHKFQIANQEGYITVGLYEDGMPGEIFMVMSKEGSVVSGLMDSFATSISIALQYGVPLKVLVSKFIHARFEPSGVTNNPEIRMAKSISDYIFKWLALKFLPEEDWEALGIKKTGQEVNLKLNDAKQQDQMTLSIFEFDKNKKDDHGDAPLCHQCGGLMVRSGSCYVCLTCGASSGCS
jgi:ribonucleoside-diphosphate reductase alpha chain